MKTLAVIFIALVGTAVSTSAGAAGPPDPGEIKVPRMIVPATVDAIDGARREALRAADRLRAPIAKETLQKPPARRHYVGNVISLLRAANGKIAVVGYLGDASDAETELVNMRKLFPTAMLVA